MIKKYLTAAGALLASMMPNLRTTHGRRPAPKPVKKAQADFMALAAAQAKRERKAALRRSAQ